MHSMPPVVAVLLTCFLPATLRYSGLAGDADQCVAKVKTARNTRRNIAPKLKCFNCKEL
jgi:hypothetical protein